FADSVGAQIFSTSLGYTTFDGGLGDHSYADMDGKTTVITQAANKAFSKGILVINSAGNEGEKQWRYISAPADGDSVMAIGAVDSPRVIAGFSSRGPTSAGRIKPDVCAQGAGVKILGGDGRPATSGGTSFSCPITAGCAASLWSAFPDKSAREIRDAIMISADRFWTPDNNYGYGIPNFYNAYLFLKTDYNGGILRVNDKMVVYPNPIESELNVSLFQEEEGEHTLELFNLLGQKVYTNRFYVRNKTFEMIKMNVGDLAVGEYVLRIDGKKQDARRLVKLK
ncbi:MAG TPA: S8 family serine peptidase, partial [Chitinophagales bacterium]|nr:S8 family serine peptidase [Chitinophagales bacterium]